MSRAVASESKSQASHDPRGLDTLGGLTHYIDEQLKLGTRNLYADYQALTDAHLLRHVLQQTSGNLSQAARLLGITRTTLRTKLAALGIPAGRPPVQEGGDR